MHYAMHGACAALGAQPQQRQQCDTRISLYFHTASVISLLVCTALRYTHDTDLRPSIQSFDAFANLT